MGLEEKTAQDYFDILKRRKWSVILPASIIFVIAALVAFLLPPIYRSTSTILIEDQEVPRDYINTTVTGFADQRLQTINQRIMGTDRLLDIINRFNLYPDLRRKWTTEEVIEEFRKAIKLNTISADVIDPRTGMARPATIAFTLSYEGKNPQLVQRVANELASLYLGENLKVRERQSQGTSQFFEDEMKNVQAQLASAEAKLAAYKQRNVNALPELAQTNLQLLDMAERDLNSFNDQLRTLREKESYLQAQLASMPTDSANQDKARLSELRVRLGELKTRFTDEHPDVIKTKSELAELTKQLRSSGRDSADNKPDNAAYVTLASQVAGLLSEIDSVKRQIETTTRKRDDYRRRIASAPGVEEGYRTIMVERNNLQLKFDDLSKKFMEARTAHGLEKENKGERFTLIDAARFPEKPVKPRIPLILLIGLVLGLGGGVGVTAFNEQNDQTARTPEVLALATAFPVLASIPEIVTWQDIVKEKTQRRKLCIGVLLFLALCPLAFHYLVMDLDVFWAKALRRISHL
jgi:protein tyrosine kinase modulator